MNQLFRLLSVLAWAAGVSIGGAAHAQQVDVASAPPINILDGQRFAGEFVPSGKASGRPDEFVFTDGKFHSRQCLTYGFSPGPYWVRVEDGQVQFLARLTSEDNGVMIYEGSIAGSTIDARIEWTKPRWYWTMTRDFRFQGVGGADAAVQSK